ncbi:CRISPR-associated helicase Cas3' [Streptomyces halobius]|uniref:CRISPR-associated helicase Cas3 n=1 Tax=Streptomyces halobius TaxID=2879846 RepID=A0ABY4LZ25_9ACTN|nr:CRISPR-associated helicase Cas3' [Streptomyces halobius]UQA90754.1 CRISPR-associated helicase Cas3' [Streptomyces halobius]
MDLLTAFLAKSARKKRPAELLTGHLSDTLTAAGALRRRVGRLDVAETVLGGQFWTATALAALAHDAGKLPDGFQDMLRGKIRSWGERHEVLSLGFLPHLVSDPDLLIWVASAVATHHRPLTGEAGKDLQTLYGPSDLDEVRHRFTPIPEAGAAALLDWLRTTASAEGLPIHAPTAPSELSITTLLETTHQMLGQLLDHWSLRSAGPDEGLTAVLVQGAVTLADHLSSAHQQLATTQPLDASTRSRVDKHLAQRGAVVRPHQIAAGDVLGHLMLRAPTGSGKTEAALLWAAAQVTNLAERTGGVPRVFYTLPYLASINAMTTRLQTLLDDEEAVGVAHSRAASYHLARAIAPEDGSDHDVDGTPCRADAAAKAVSRAAATKLFHETLRVGTPYQLLRAALAGPAHSGILVDAANSVFVLDELHAYDAQRLGYILASARMWERLGGKVAVLSATLPKALATLFTETLTPNSTTEVHSPDLGLPARHRLSTRDHHLTDPQAVNEIRRRLENGDSVLVVANNVAHALDLYDELAPEVVERHGPEAALLLHSRFRRVDRATIEDNIGKRFGTCAQRRPGLLVATQVVEVSLDVDFDVLFTAAAPVEALLQRFGRVNRIAARPSADVIVHAPSWTSRRGTIGQYADGIYPRDPVEAGWRFLAAHHGHIVDETDATRWLDTIYTDSWGAQWRTDVLQHREAFEQAFLRFEYPYDDRDHLTEQFDQLFDGTEAILARDQEGYEAALDQAPDASAGRLLADEYLIPMPHWAGRLTTYEKRLKVRIIDGDYTPERGLLSVSRLPQQTYQPGEVL